MNKLQLLSTAINAALEAGKKILSVYSEEVKVELKEDRTPLTKADKLSHQSIVELLKSTGLPVLSEEGRDIPYFERSHWNKFWLVDPLDGTKEFIKRNGEFTVNIALIENGQPVLGVILVPASDVLYFGSAETGSYVVNDASRKSVTDVSSLMNESTLLPSHQDRDSYTVIASRSHASAETSALIETLRKKYGELTFISKGSSLKLCLVAEGMADLYPRLAPTMEWDTAAGDAIARAAGCKVLQHPSGKPLQYNKENLLNPHFIVSRDEKP
jgi:3'(2'), 5'-bisphosphate nucleotidase